MLKISVLDTLTQRRLVLEGALLPPWVEELNAACERAGEGLKGRQLVIDMTNLTAISPEGENALLQLMHEGVRLRSTGVFTKHVAQQLARRRGNVSGKQRWANRK
jgi:hypothetical protein